MSANPHHLLDLFENIHEKYKLQENDYKVFVEALGGKREAIDFENAKFVEIWCDEYSTSFNEEKDVEEVHCLPNVKKIFRIVGNSVQFSDPNLSNIGSRSRQDDVKYFLDNQSTTMDRYQLQLLSHRYARSDQDNFHINVTEKLPYCDDAYLVHIKSMKVLE